MLWHFEEVRHGVSAQLLRVPVWLWCPAKLFVKEEAEKEEEEEEEKENVKRGYNREEA